MLIPSLEQLTALVQPWADLYADSKTLPTVTALLHIGGMFAGGGMAVATDRAILRASPSDGRGQRAVLANVASTHTLVISALVVIVVSGLLFLTADLKTFAVSRVYWVKMGVVLILLGNGLRLWRAEDRLKKSALAGSETDALPAAEWKTLRQTAVTSLLGWFTTMALGIILANA